MISGVSNRTSRARLTLAASHASHLPYHMLRIVPADQHQTVREWPPSFSAPNTVAMTIALTIPEPVVVGEPSKIILISSAFTIASLVCRRAMGELDVGGDFI